MALKVAYLISDFCSDAAGSGLLLAAMSPDGPLENISLKLGRCRAASDGGTAKNFVNLNAPESELTSHSVNRIRLDFSRHPFVL